MHDDQQPSPVLTSEEFDKLSEANRKTAFRISGLHNARVVQEARDLVHRAIRDGQSYTEIRKALMDLFRVKGLPVPSLNHLRTVYRRNTIQAYNDTRRETLSKPVTTKLFPFWQYLTVGNGKAGVNNVRASHAAFHGKVFAWDDPFWGQFMPPWEWGCRCFFRAVREREVIRKQLTVWTYAGGRIRPVSKSGGRRPKPQSVQARPGAGFMGQQFTKTGLGDFDEALKKVVDEAVKR
jgi:SPP1 gp7 family putative phage head morphogenesis protein